MSKCKVKIKYFKWFKGGWTDTLFDDLNHVVRKARQNHKKHCWFQNKKILVVDWGIEGIAFYSLPLPPHAKARGIRGANL